MQQIIGRIEETLQSGSPLVLLTVMKSEGSAPRGLGASMIVLPDGKTFGTVGGGTVEYTAIQHALELLCSPRSETQLYRLHSNEVADLGMICGGSVWILFDCILPKGKDRAVFHRLFQANENGVPAYFVRRIENGAVIDSGVLDVEGMHETSQIASDSVKALAATRAVLTEDEPRLLIEPVGANARVYLFGGGHVSQKLVPVLSYVGFRVTVLEDRAEFAEPALFPAADDVRMCDFSDVSKAAPVTERDYIVIMTRGHMADYEILRQALCTQATYIGCIGSRHKIALTKQRLYGDGFTDDGFARVHTPIGLPIRAETPEEIAISIAAEMIEHRARH